MESEELNRQYDADFEQIRRMANYIYQSTTDDLNGHEDVSPRHNKITNGDESNDDDDVSSRNNKRRKDEKEKERSDDVKVPS